MRALFPFHLTTRTLEYMCIVFSDDCPQICRCTLTAKVVMCIFAQVFVYVVCAKLCVFSFFFISLFTFDHRNRLDSNSNTYYKELGDLITFSAKTHKQNNLTNHNYVIKYQTVSVS